MKTSIVNNLKTYAIALAGGLMLLVGFSPKSEAAAVCATPGTFDSLIGTSCAIGDKTFSDFFFQSSDILASNVTYTTIDGTNGLWGFRFQFSLTTIGSNTSKDFALGYRVACTDGSDCIDSIHAQMTGSGAGGGIASLTESYVGPGGFHGDFFLYSPGGPTSYALDFDPVAYLDISKDINVACPVTTGTCIATFSILWNTVDQVPEPGSLALLGMGLLGLGAARRRRA